MTIHIVMKDLSPVVEKHKYEIFSSTPVEFMKKGWTSPHYLAPGLAFTA